MRYLSIFILGVFMLVGVQANALDARFSYYTFYSPAAGPYVETCLLVDAVSLNFQKQDDDSYIGQVNLTIMFKRGDEVINFSKIRLNSPSQEELEGSRYFIDYQRFALPKGAYDLVVVVSDAATPDKEYTHEERINVGFEPEVVGISSVELLQSYEKADEKEESKLAKNGYEIVPKVVSFYGEHDESLPFYCEIYNTDTILGNDEPMIIYYYVRSFETKNPIASLSSFKRTKAADVHILLSKFDIRNMPSGNYEMCVEVRNRENQILVQNTTFFQRSNPNVKFNEEYLVSVSVEKTFVSQYASIDTLRDYVSSLHPIATEMEKQFIFHQVKTSDLEILQRFLYNFWLERDEINPERAWMEYKGAVDQVNRLYSVGRMKGYSTDRGRVYLQYGAPNVIVDRAFDTGNSGFTTNPDGSDYQDGGTVPYQIWHYEVLDNQRDRRFVFANKHIAAGTYELIHSDAVGEIYNSQWQAELSRKTFDSNLNSRTSRSYDGQSGEYYRVPY